ncbi:helix-turn-helix domain-containing protein [Yinghuangia seranimata]|uniref:helix-turn-helix domain-containing protein n=1 Tax=Yinghuangia seranimata TaxID=408067 RepID=UPI00248B3EA4|nr:helix-turn-helix transcriptional regulator [Yinghuangia seranimata]MDI2129993.1 helix-turn-helix transcriptional regulator [Yinghuangia seranimata]
MSDEDIEVVSCFFHAVGTQIRLLREQAGLSRQELAAALGYSPDQIYSVEAGRRTPHPELLRAADEPLNARGLLKGVADDVEKVKEKTRIRHPDWFRGYARLETEAVELGYFSTLAVPGLMQTEDYARATFLGAQPPLSEEQLEERVAARMARQEILTRWPPPTVSVVLDESVLMRRIGGSHVHQGQLEHLLRLASLPGITLQVLSLGCEQHSGMNGPFILLTPRSRHPVGYLEIQQVNRIVTHAEEVRMLNVRFGALRAQALTPPESIALIKRMLGER